MKLALETLAESPTASCNKSVTVGFYRNRIFVEKFARNSVSVVTKFVKWFSSPDTRVDGQTGFAKLIGNFCCELTEIGDHCLFSILNN